MSKQVISNSIKSKAQELGFLFAAMAKADFMEPEALRLEEWLNNGNHGEMSYMENHFDMRTDPRILVPGAKTVISLAYNYYTEAKPADPSAPKIASYAYGRDYHKVVRKKLNQLLEWIRQSYGEVAGRGFVDSAPVLERDWARRSGLGWVGKHTLLIHPRQGSYFFLADLIIDLEMAYDAPISDYCGTCTRCIDACPTDAIHPDGYHLNGSQCISYLTIELKNQLPEYFRDKMENWIFGCDICQQVCPWNRFSTPHTEPDFIPKPQLMDMKKEEWSDLTEPLFDTLFEGTPVKRTKYEGLLRNIRFLGDDTD